MTLTSLLLVAAALSLSQSEGGVSSDHDAAAATVEWRHYGADRASSKYSPAAQIDAGNVARLKVAWRWPSPDDELELSVPANDLKVTPLMVGGRLYATTAYNLVVALDPASGRELWRYDPKAYERGRPPHGGFNSRGLEYWTDGKVERLFIATSTLQLIALDAKTGTPDPQFGVGGEVDLRQRLDRDYVERDIAINSPPIACADTVVVGSVINDFGGSKRMPPGHVRGYDARSGERRFIFHTIPQPGEHGVDTWEEGSWEYSGNTNVWTLMSCDDELGYVYLPIGTPTNDHYGGHRLGDNLFAESLVALDAKTGERVWHFQAVHHGLWDYDFPCAPNLVDITVDGRAIKAVAQVSKQGFTYVFDRRTGAPVWPIEERSVPPSSVPGERAAATQPFPTKPPPFERQGIAVDDLIDFTPELKAKALAIAERFVLGPLFAPPIVGGEDGKLGLIQLPGMAGGANWGGAAFDPESGLLYVPSWTRPGVMGLRPGGGRSDLRYNRGGGGADGPDGLPLVKPPWSRLTAIDLNRGEHAWQVAHGEGLDDHPALRGLELPPLGSAQGAGLVPGWPLATKTLLFVAQAVAGEGADFGLGPAGDSRGFLRAFDKTTGAVIWEEPTETAPRGAPMTYVHLGKQYLVTAFGGRGQARELAAWALP